MLGSEIARERYAGPNQTEYNPMLKPTCDQMEIMSIDKSRKTSVWRDGIFALLASLGVGLLAATLLTVVVFAITAVAVG